MPAWGEPRGDSARPAPAVQRGLGAAQRAEMGGRAGGAMGSGWAADRGRRVPSVPQVAVQRRRERVLPACAVLACALVLSLAIALHLL